MKISRQDHTAFRQRREPELHPPGESVTMHIRLGRGDPVSERLPALDVLATRKLCQFPVKHIEFIEQLVLRHAPKLI